MYMGLMMADCMRRKLLGTVSVDFDATVPYSAFVKYLKKNGNAMKQLINYLYTSRRLINRLEGKSCIIFSFSLLLP
jgi:hypothetical protein